MIWDDNDDICLVQCSAKRRVIQTHLDALREERRPYVFITDKMQSITHLERILVPVTMLEEEVYKAEIATYLARKTNATIVILQANDYGSHARQNVQRIVTHIQTVAERIGSNIPYEVQQAKKDSFHLHQEVTQTRDLPCQLLLLTASREYGLDDWIFGPPEQKVILHSTVPVMLVNPRADLFSLCD